MKLFHLITLSFIAYSAVAIADQTTTSTVTSVDTVDTTTIAPAATTTTTTTTTTPDPNTPTPQDDAIVTAAYNLFNKAPALIGTALTVSSLNGIVTVSGTVTSQSQADAAVEAAKSIAGVRDVRSAITVTTNPINQSNTIYVPNY